jgi:hypothetical protein
MVKARLCRERRRRADLLTVGVGCAGGYPPGSVPEKIDKGSGSMFDIKRIFDWAKDNGEVKAVDRILIKVMLLLIKNKITLTAATIEKMETRMALPEELTAAIVRAAGEVVGKPVPDFLLAREASHV